MKPTPQYGKTMKRAAAEKVKISNTGRSSIFFFRRFFVLAFVYIICFKLAQTRKYK